LCKQVTTSCKRDVLCVQQQPTFWMLPSGMWHHVAKYLCFGGACYPQKEAVCSMETGPYCRSSHYRILFSVINATNLQSLWQNCKMLLFAHRDLHINNWTTVGVVLFEYFPHEHHGSNCNYSCFT